MRSSFLGREPVVTGTIRRPPQGARRVTNRGELELRAGTLEALPFLLMRGIEFGSSAKTRDVVLRQS